MQKQISLDKLFIKHYKQRVFGNKALVVRYEERVKLFLEDRSNPTLKDHQLEGEMKKYRSFSITGDCRVIYLEEEKEIVFLFVDIGSHNQVYR